MVEALRKSDVVYVDVSGTRGPEVAGVSLGLAALEASSLSVGGGEGGSVRRGEAGGRRLTDVTGHFGAISALMWTVICSRNPSTEAAVRGIELARRASIDVRELEWLEEYAADPTRVREVLAEVDQSRETVRVIVEALRRRGEAGR
ncbi:hypothetical protein [Methanopyrus sp.]